MSGESTETTGTVPSQLAYLVPTFDPSKDDVQIYAQKVQMILSVWPATKVSELITGLILNTSVTALKTAIAPRLLKNTLVRPSISVLQDNVFLLLFSLRHTGPVTLLTTNNANTMQCKEFFGCLI